MFKPAKISEPSQSGELHATKTAPIRSKFRSMWHPSSWSVFQQSVRTNNDTERWHHGLNRRAQGKSQIPFYLLIELLFKEAKLASLQIRLVSERKLKRIQRRKYLDIQARLFDAWEKFEKGDISANRLLKKASHIIASRF